MLALEPKAFLKYLQDRFEAEQESEDPLVHFKLFMMILRILVMEEKFELIGAKETERYIKLAENLLLLQGISPNSRSDFIFLYADLRNISGQILRRRGEHLPALWETQIAHRFSDGAPGGLNLVLANRFMRVGRIADAQERLSLVSASNVHRYEYLRAGISRLQCARLNWRLEEFTKTAEELAATFDENDTAFKLEIEWMKLTLSFQQNNQPEAILAKIKRGGTHFSPEYVMDGILWVLASSHKSLVQELPAVSKLRRNGVMSFTKQETDFEVVESLQASYNTAVELDRRIRLLGESLRLFPQLILIETEMLAWIAAARFLARSRALDLAKTCIERYKQISMTVSNGQDLDVLKLTKDFSLS
jgi:hypothetical protein